MFQVSAGTLQDLVSLPATGVEAFEVQVLLGTRLCQLNLRKHEVRSSNFQLVVQDEDGSRVVATPPCITYRGEVVGQGNSMVAASLVAGRLTALVRLGDADTFWGIQPVGGDGSGNGINRFTHISYDSAHNVLGKHTCGVVDDEHPAKPAASYGPMSAQVWFCDLACDADYDFYKANGSSVTNTQNDITTVINNVAVIYKRDVNIDYKITQIIVRTSRTYTGTYASVSEMRSRWIYYHTSVPRDLAHLFTGRSLGGTTIGVAYLSSVCSTDSGYGVSRSRYTNNMTSRTALTAHEIGHGWSSPHCDGQNPCNIMCSALGGCSRGLTSFGSFAQGYIVNHRNSRTCLTIGGIAPVLTGISPSTVPAFPPSSITLTGTGFTNVTKVNVGGQVASQLKVLSDTQLTCVTPAPKNLLPVAVNADINGSTSNSLPLYWNPTSPPKLVAYQTAKPGGAMLWQYGAGPSNLWFLTLSPSGETNSILGQSWLKTSMLINSGTLDAAGLGLSGAWVPQSTALGLKIYSQVVTLDPLKGLFAGNTNVTVTTTSNQ